MKWIELPKSAWQKYQEEKDDIWPRSFEQILIEHLENRK